MTQAASASTTRRALIAGATSLPVAAAVAPVANLPAIFVQPVNARAESSGEVWRRNKREFIEQIAFLHPMGRLSATRAMAMDLDPAGCIGVQLYDAFHPERMPTLSFRKRADPTRMIYVKPHEAWECGPVPRGLGQRIVEPEASV